MEYNNLFKTQIRVFGISKGKDEFETTQCIFKISNQFSMSHAMNMKYLEDLQNAEKEEAGPSSSWWREKGNDLKLKLKKTKSLADLYECAALYTKAIFSAQNKSEAAGLAYANRAVILQKLGLLKQANDDCIAANENNYPKKLAYKLLLRQAWCAAHLDDPLATQFYLEQIRTEHADISQTLRHDIESIETLLHDPCAAQEEDKEIEKSCKEVDLSAVKVHQPTAFQCDERKGRFMIAAEDIKAKELIFEERAVSFVPIKNAMICHNCAATLFIPYPCLACKARVVYCSIQCRNEQAKTHAFECAGYAISFFDKTGIGHLALRVLLDHMPELLTLLRRKTSARDVWDALVYGNEIKDTLYWRSFEMCSNHKFLTLQEVSNFLLNSNLILSYLRGHTNLLDSVVKKTTISKNDWMLVIASLLLRHHCQLMPNAHVSNSLVPKCFVSSNKYEFPLLSSELWVRPFVIRKGELHKFSNIAAIASMNLPYFSLCNHSCERMLQPSFKGRKVAIYAHKDIKKDAEISNTYIPDHKSNMFEARRTILKDIYYFTCDCAKCVRTNPDQDYREFHRYRCLNCQTVFVPNIPGAQSLKWWQFDSKPAIKCIACGVFQNFSWINAFSMKVENCGDAETRRSLYKDFENIGQQLLEDNEFKMSMASDIIENCFKAFDSDVPLNDDDFAALADIINAYLDFTAKKSGVFSLDYASKMTYLWDIIALGKYQCSAVTLSKQKEIVELLSEDNQKVFNEYFVNYIEKYMIE